MKIISTCLALGAGLACLGTAQGQSWTKQYPVELPALLDIQTLTALDAIAVGVSGTLIRTTNGGQDWFEASLASDVLHGLYFDGPYGWAVGDGIFRTTDFGATWTKTNSSEGVRDVCFANPDLGWAAADGGRVLRSTNGGFSWSSQVLAGAPGRLLAVHFVDPLQGWVVGDGGAHFRTVDGGASWTPVPTGTTTNLTDVYYANALQGRIAAGDRVLHTTDGGQTWTDRMMPSGVLIESFTFLAGKAWGSGPGGDIVRSKNGGKLWTLRFSNGGSPLRDICMGDTLNGLAVGDSGNVYRTVDGGFAWTQVRGGQASQPPSVLGFAALDDKRAWAAASEGKVLRTVDGGQSWVEFPGASDLSTLFFAIDFWDDLRGYAVGDKQAFYPTTAWTSDGGKTWSVTNHIGMYDILDVDAIGPLTAVASTTSKIWRTTDGGKSWAWISTSPAASYYAADFIDSSRGWIVGTAFFQTTDGGLTWTHQKAATEKYWDVSFADASNGWAVGQNGAVQHTTDGGQTWMVQNSGTTNTLNGVEAVSPSVAWVVGENGYVAKTADGGATWTQETPPGGGGTNFRDLAFFAEDQGWVVGAWAPGIWKREPGGGCQVANYCQAKTNSLGGLAVLSGVGAPSAAQGSFGVMVTGAVPKRLAILIDGQAGGASVPFFGGTLCVAQPFKRDTVQVLDGAGSTTFTLTVDNSMVGATHWYQVWYRDSGHPDGTGVALSDGLRVTFCQ